MKKILFCFSLCFFSVVSTTTAQTAYNIYPVPQQIVANSGSVSFTAQVNVVCEDGIDTATRSRITQVLSDHGLQATLSPAASASLSNIYLGINGSSGLADAKATALALQRSVFSTADKYDRHLLSLFAENGRAAAVILGENTDATFYGIASLEQILDNGTEQLTPTDIYDYADQKSRGLVEGYYGYPYSIEVKKDLMRFMMRHKMNTYLYGAKSDPYHSQKWKEAYPTSLTAEQEKNGWLSQDMIREITEMSAATKVNFIWAIHPGTDFISSSTVISDIMGKYDKMYKLGVRQFAVFVDDVGVPSTDAEFTTNASNLTKLQKSLEEKYNTTGAAPADTVRPVHFVPQIYCSNFAAADVRKKFFNALAETPSYITIYTTGQGVWSVPNSSDLATVKNDLGRNVGWWWNYPCNDNADGQIYTMDMYSNFYDLPSVNSSATLPSRLTGGLGIVSNPMQEGEVAKTALFSVADYAWNNAGFKNEQSWQASFAAVLPGNETAQAAYKFLAPYLRYNDPSALATLITQYKNGSNVAADITNTMNEIITNCDVLAQLKDSQTESERLLYTDLAPWLLKLREMASVTNDLLATAAEESTDNARWEAYLAELQRVNALSTAEEFKAYALEGMGNSISVSERPSQPSELYLIKFIDYLKENALNGYFSNPLTQSRHQVFTNVDGLTLTISGSTTMSLIQSKVFTLAKGQYVGVKLKEPVRVKSITVADTLVANHSVVFSPDGKHWTRLTQTVTQPEAYVRYVALVNDDERVTPLKLLAKSIQIALFETTKVRETTIPDGNIWNNMTKDKMTDGDYTTFVCLNRNQKANDAYTLTLTKKQPIRLVRVGMGTVNDDYMKVGKVQISADGTTWKDLKVKGTNTTSFTMSLKQCFTYSDAVKICDFDGEGQEALYVRLLVSQPNTSKWLRLYEIEVNGDGAYNEARCADGASLAQTQVCDGKASTSSESALLNELTYHFQEPYFLKSVKLYNDPLTTSTATIEATTDGAEWTSLGGFTASIQEIDFSSLRNATALRITWSGSTVPAIYEIVENSSETEFPQVTEIKPIGNNDSSPAGLGASLSLSSGKILAHAAEGIARVEIFSANGSRLLLQQLHGAKHVVIPLTTAAPGVLIVKLALSDGTTKNFKIAFAK